MASIESRGSKDQKVTYRAKVRLKGFPLQTASFRRLTDAKRWVQQTESAIREGRHFKTSAAKKHTLSEAIDAYVLIILPRKPKSEHDQFTQLQWWKKAIGSHSLADVTPQLIVKHRDQLAKEITVRGQQRSTATVNRYLAVLSHLFTMAVKEWGWLESNPLLKVSKLKETRGRVRFLSDNEREHLLKICQQSDSHYLYLIVVLCLSTGARKMEILGLRWENVDLNRAVITLHETKNGERRLLPLTGHALKLMKQHAKVKAVSTSLVFPSKNLKKPIDIRTPWETVVRRAGIADFRFHDLRHSAASYLAMSGASPTEIASILGHKTLQMVKRYAHLSEAHTSKVVARMNEKIFGE
ncbi:MAG: site-specific integrase [Gammaproteobacteria bacterium]|jgi:integrase